MRPASPAAVFLLATLVLVWPRPANGSPIAFDHAGDPERPEGGGGPSGDPSVQNIQRPPSTASEPDPSRREPSSLTGKPSGSAGDRSTGFGERARPAASAACHSWEWPT